MTSYRLDIVGPHGDDYTRHVADALAESVRVLNHATQLQPDTTDPATVHHVLGSLHDAAQRMDQLLGQLDRHLVRFGSYDLADSSGGNPNVALGTAHLAIEGALTAAADLAGHLSESFNATSGLYLREDDDR